MFGQSMTFRKRLCRWFRSSLAETDDLPCYPSVTVIRRAIMRTAGVAMGNQHHIVAVWRKNAQRPVGDGHGRHDGPALQAEITGDKGFLQPSMPPHNPRAIHAAVKQAAARAAITWIRIYQVKPGRHDRVFFLSMSIPAKRLVRCHRAADATEAPC